MVDIRLTSLARRAGVALALAASSAAADPPHARATQTAMFTGLGDALRRAARCSIRTAVRGADGTEVLRLEVVRDAAALAFRTALPLHLPDGVTLAIGDPSHCEPSPWRTCDPTGCVAEAPLADDLRAALERERTIEVTLTLVDGVRVRLSVSLLGFTAASTALAAEAPAPGVSPP